jgi:Ca2+-binding RTX toxin-like protein
MAINYLHYIIVPHIFRKCCNIELSDLTFLQEQVAAPIVRIVRYDSATGLPIYGFTRPTNNLFGDAGLTVELGALGSFDIMSSEWAAYIPLNTPGVIKNNVTSPFGLRNVSGLFNNLANNSSYAWGSLDRPFSYLSNADYSSYVGQNNTNTAFKSQIKADPLQQDAIDALTSAGTLWQDLTPAEKALVQNSNWSQTTDINGNVDNSQRYANPFLTVYDYTPRIISQTVDSAFASTDAVFVTDSETGLPTNVILKSKTLSAQDRIEALVLGDKSTSPSGNRKSTVTDTTTFMKNGVEVTEKFQRNLASLSGDPSLSGWNMLFGQFFDHGLDSIGKGGNKINGKSSKIITPIGPNDPYAAQGVTQLSISRATVANPEQAGADGQFGTADDIVSPGVDGVYGNSDDVLGKANPEYNNHVSPYIDQSQTYGSDDNVTNLLRKWVLDPTTGQYVAGMELLDGYTLKDEWNRTSPDGVVEKTRATLPTLNELRKHLALTGRDDINWEDVGNFRVRDANGHVLDRDLDTVGLQSISTGSPLLLDMLNRLDADHLLVDPFAGVAGHTDLLAGFNAAHISRGSDTDSAQGSYISDYINLQSGQPTTFGAAPANGAIFNEILLRSIGDHYIAGDGRVNENFGLTAIHHVWHEDHNWQIDNIISAVAKQQAADPTHTIAHVFQTGILAPSEFTNSATIIKNADGFYEDDKGNYVDSTGLISWNQEKMFQAATLIVQTEYQHVAIDQYARGMSPNIPLFVLYDSSVNSDVSIEYSQGAYRFGHSQLRETIDILDPNGSLSGMVTKFALEQAFLNPAEFAKNGPTAIAQGMTRQYSSEIDEIVTPSLQQSLLGQPQDLAAINIMRGRDLGLPTLNAMRRSLSNGIEADLVALQNKLLLNPGDKFLQDKISQTISLKNGLTPYASWNDFGANIIHHEALINFIAAYSFDGDLNKAMTVVRLGEGGAVGVLSDRDQGYKDIWVDSPGDTTQGWTAAKEATVIASLGWNNISGDVNNAQTKALDFLSVSTTADKGFEKIDSWVGGLAEKHVYLGELGSTFDAIFADQMTRLINGDRFYYFWRLQLGLPEFTQLSSSVTTEQFKDVIERTTGAQHLTGNVFFATDSHIELGENPNEILLDSLGQPVSDSSDNLVLKNANATDDAASHRYGNKVDQYASNANADLTTGIGVYSNSGYSNILDGQTFNVGFDINNKITGLASKIVKTRTYIRDTRINGGDNPDGTPSYGFNSHETIAGTRFGDYIDAGDGDDTEYGDDGNDILIGNAGADHVYGENGDDYIDGGELPDFLDGGEGNDEVHGGNDVDVVIGGNGNDSLFGEAGVDEVQGGNGDDYLNGGSEADFIYAGYGNDIVLGEEGLDTEFGEWGDDQMFGGAGPDQLFGGQGDDILHGGSGGNNLNLNVDECLGGAGFNINSYNDLSLTLDVIADLNFQNINPVGSTAAQSAPFGQLLVDIQGLEGTGFSDQMIGDVTNNWLIGGGGSDILSGGAGDDVIIGDSIRLDILDGTYNPTKTVLSGGLLGTSDKHFTDLLKSYENFEFGKDGGAVGSNDTVTYAGARGNFTIITLDIHGADVTGTTNTPYALRVIDTTGAETTSAGDLLIGIDKLVFGYDFEAISTGGNRPHVFIDPTTISTYVDPVTHVPATIENTLMNINDAPALTGAAGLLGIGNTNTPYTINVSTLLQGYTDADVSDTFSVTGLTATNGSVDLATDGINYVFTPNTGFTGIAKISYQVVDNHNAATNASKNLTIASFIETVGNTSLVLFNGFYVAVDPATNALTNIKYQGVNVSPTSRSGWTIIGAEKNAAGVIGVIWKDFSNPVKYWYSTNTNNGAEVPDVTTYEASFKQDLNSDGYITTYGTAGNDTLGGLNANEKLIGGLGDDLYIVDSANDLVVEQSSQGTDTVNASASVTLATNVEDLNLTGTGDINGTGNALNNVITGNSGNNVLDGGAGNDTLTGGNGNDTYVVDSILDSVVESAIGGVDTVNSSVSYTLGNNVENLNLTGSSDINGTGNTSDNAITGNSGNNVLDGGAGNDTFTGGDGNDTYVVDSTGDSVVESSSATGGTDTVNSSVSYTLGANVENLNLTGTGNIDGTGNTSDNAITGNSGNNVLDGGAGNDTLTGGDGNDTYVVDSTGDSVIETSATGGIDTVNSSASFALGAYIENLNLTGTGNINGTGNALNNVITGNSGNNVLDGGAGNDVMTGGDGDDTYVVDSTLDSVVESSSATGGTDTVNSSVSYTLGAFVENLNLIGTAINGTGNASDNAITGNSGNNVLDGGAGNDVMTGGDGDDTYVVDSTLDSVVETATGGVDTVNSSVSYTLGANVENLNLTGTAANGTGNASDNAITGNSGNNVLDGGAGNDTLTGGNGNDTYVVDSILDSVVESATGGVDTVNSSVSYTLGNNVENLNLTGASDINGTGNGLANTITGNSGNNVLDGGAGNDTLTGGAGNDLYIIDSASDLVVESAAGGTDTINSSVTFSLTALANVENLTLTGTAVINGTGNALDNIITGNNAVNTLTGGAGNDTYYVTVGDTVSETIAGAAGGTDLVISSDNFSIATFANVENLTLTGTAVNGTGNALANIITGNSAVNTLTGGNGSDTYYVTAGDIVVETTGGATGGTDLVISSDNFSIATFANVENLTLTGTAVNGSGNTLANAIIGNDGDNILDGGAGNDTLTGRNGNDTYIVDSTTDSVVEIAGAGTDTIKSSVTIATLAANVENLTLTGTTAINGTGNALDNVITGNSGNNTLNGGAGTDNLIGGAGNDTYVVDSTTDTLLENAGEGTDLVSSSVTFSLAAIANVENLTLTGTAANGTGNSLANTITGNSGINILDGGAGADTLIGGTGNDIYYIDDAADIVNEVTGGATGGTDIVMSSVTTTLTTNVENLTLIGAATIDATGNTSANIITGNSANNTLTGGAGTDTFVLLNTGGGLDTITDFTVSATASLNEKLDVRNFGITNDLFTVGSGAGFNAAASGNQLFIYDTTSKALYFDADGSGGTFGAVQIANLTLTTGSTTLTVNNFIRV